MNLTHTKKFRHGSVSVALTVVVIAAVILLNAIFTALSQKYLWYIDMTPEPRFTLSEEAKEVLEAMDTSKEVNIILCDEKYAWEEDTIQLEVLKTALDIELLCPNVHVRYTDIYTNPSSVSEYRELTGKNITTQSVIVTCENAVRVYNLEDFFVLDSNDYVDGYDGEQVFVSSLLSVTQASAPMACITSNHGEVYSEALLKLLEQIGFQIKAVDLTTEDLPAECRLLVIFDPQSDFVVGGLSEVSEISKIEEFLDKNNSMMVFVDKDTPYLQNLEQLLAEWGIEIARTDDNDNTVIEDLASSLSVNGYTNKAIYEEGGMGADITKHMRENGVKKTVAFPNTTALRFSSLYQETRFEDYRSAYYSGNVERRTCYNVFFSSPSAVAKAKGETVSQASENLPYTYMMLSCQTDADDANNAIKHSFVLACASTDFASAAALDRSYGNASVLSYACNTMGSLVVPVSLDCKYYASMQITSITTQAANQFTVIFTVIPASIVFIAGIYVMIRRKHA
ncbi:MAG: Gldg family protein [Clostridia bacterium]|nr:Gldg family protein [Clostridia bacterium]